MAFPLKREAWERILAERAEWARRVTFSAPPAPMMAAAMFGCRSTHASATWDIVSPASSATGRSRCTASSMSSVSHCLMKRFILLEVARDPSGGGTPGRYLPVSTP